MKKNFLKKNFVITKDNEKYYVFEIICIIKYVMITLKKLRHTLKDMNEKYYTCLKQSIYNKVCYTRIASLNFVIFIIL